MLIAPIMKVVIRLLKLVSNAIQIKTAPIISNLIKNVIWKLTSAQFVEPTRAAPIIKNALEVNAMSVSEVLLTANNTSVLDLIVMLTLHLAKSVCLIFLAQTIMNNAIPKEIVYH